MERADPRRGGSRAHVTRTVHPTVPPKGEYELTPVARELHETLQRLTDRAERNRVYIAQSRVAYDAEHEPELVRRRWSDGAGLTAYSPNRLGSVASSLK